MSDNLPSNLKSDENLIKHSSGASFTLSEKITLMKYINDVLKKLSQEYNQEKDFEENETVSNLGRLVSNFQEFDIETEGKMESDHDAFFNRFTNGIILSLLLYNVNSAIMNLKSVESNTANTFKMIENLKRVIQSAKNLGLVIVGIDTSLIQEAKPTPILSLLSQIMRVDFTNCIRLNNTIQMIFLKKSDETIQSFLQQDPKELLLRWINFVLSTDPNTSNITVSNISNDFKDSTVYMNLIRNIAPNIISESDVEEVLAIEDLKDRALAFLEKLEKIQLSRRIFITANDITSGKSYMNIALLGSIFNDYGVTSLSDHFDMDPQVMIDLRSQILDITVEDLKKHMPEVRSPEFASFVAAAKSLSKASKSDDSKKIGVLSELKQVQAAATGLQQKIVDLRVEYDEKLETRIQELKNEYEEKITNLNNEREQLKNDYEEKITNLINDKEELKNEIQDLNNQIIEINFKKESLENKLKSETSILSDLKQSTKRESDRSLEERLELHNEILFLKDKNLQLKKDLTYVLNSIVDFNAEIKLATWKFGSIKIQDLTKRASMQGFVKKRSNGVVKNWKNRYWVLVDNYIFYFEDQKDNSKLKGMLRLDDCKVEGYDRYAKTEQTKFDDGAAGFVIYTSKRKMKTQVPNVEEAIKWKKAIADAGASKL